MAKSKLQQMVDRIPNGDDGWTKSSSRDTFLDMAKFLQEQGHTLDEIEDVLGGLYRAVAAEYGD